MIDVPQDRFLAYIKAGDVGVIKADNLFAKLQALYAHRFDEGPIAASHAFYVSNPPFITEANGILIKGEPQNVTFLKYVGDETKAWFFRYPNLDPIQLARMNTYAQAAVACGGHYGVGQIWQFFRSWITGKQNECDEGGVVCSEFVSDIVRAAPIAEFLDPAIPSWRIDPTRLLNWLAVQGNQNPPPWRLAAYYDGGGRYQIDEERATV